MDATMHDLAAADRDGRRGAEASAASAAPAQRVAGPSKVFAVPAPVKTDSSSRNADPQRQREAEEASSNIRGEGSRATSAVPSTSQGQTTSRAPTPGARKPSLSQSRSGSVSSFAMPSLNNAAAGSSSSGNAPLNTKQAAAQRKVQAAQKARILALSRQLEVRLQYAAFKVEHGWTKQSLSEVENLYYRHRRASQTQGSSPAAARHPIRSNVPTTPTQRPRASPSAMRRPSTSQQGNSTQPRHRASFADPPGGLMTPPPSGNTLPAGAQADAKTKTSAGTASSLPSHNPLSHTQKSPTIARAAASQQTKPASAQSTSGASYADFWSKMASSGAGSAAPKR